MRSVAGKRAPGRANKSWPKSRRTDHDQEIRQPAALQHRHQHLCDARRPRHHGEGRRGFRRLRRQDQRRHHPLGAGPDHLRAGEQGRRRTCCRSTSCASSSASTATACRCWCRAISKCRSTSLTREQDKFREQMSQAFGIGGFGPLEEQVRRNMEMFERTFAMFAPFARDEQGAGAPKPNGRSDRRPATATARSTSSSARSTRCRSGSTASATRTRPRSSGRVAATASARTAHGRSTVASPISAPCR